MGVRVEVRPTWVDPSAPSSSKQLRPSDTALASPGLWRHLRAREDAANVETSVFVSIQLPIDRRLGSKGQRRHLIVEVKQDSTLEATTGLILHLPQHLLPFSLSPFATRIRIHKPVALSLAILQPLLETNGADDASISAFTFDSDNHSSYLLRQGSTIHCCTSLSKPPQSYAVALLEPVQQGIITQSTRIVIATPAQNVHHRFISDGRSESSSHASIHDFDPDSFLSSSLSLHARSYPPLSPSYLETDDLAASAYSSTSGSLTPRPPGSEMTRAPSPAVPMEELVDGLDAALARFTAVAALGPGPSRIGSEVCWMGVPGLGRAGIFEGDWVLLRTVGGGRAGTTRLLKVLVWEKLDDSADEIPGSSILLHPRIYRSLADSDTTSLQVVVIPTPFGARQPTLPTAKTITLARVATTEGADKRYERSWLKGIKASFVDDQTTAGSSSLVKRGDLIAIPIAIGRILVDDDEEADESSDSGADSDSAVVANTSVAYFAVTSLSFDPLVPLEEDFEASTTSQARAGELGCWVDVGEEGQTRMVLTGMERDRVGRRTMDQSWLDISAPPSPASVSAMSRLRPLLSTAFSGTSLSMLLQLSVLLKGRRGSGKVSLVRSLADELGYNVVSIDAQDLLGDLVAAEGTILARLEKCRTCAPSILLLTHIETLAKRSETSASGRPPPIAKILEEALDNLRASTKDTGLPCLLIGTTADVDAMPSDLLGLFKQEISLDAPGEAERLQILRHYFDGHTLSPDTDLRVLARETAAYQAADLRSLALRAADLSLRRIAAASSLALHDVVAAGVIVQLADVKQALDEARIAYADSIGAPKIPNVSWDDVGGLADVKKDILDTIQLPMDHPELFSSGLKRRSGILLYGPPGTGKTLLAKAVATSCSLNFFSVKGPELLNMYVGESEANVRRIFQRARDAAPCVIFMDELDSVAPKRGNQGDSGGVMDRIVSQLLAELDGVAGGTGGQVFVMGATNRPDLLDPALLRPGRFDRLVYLSPPQTVMERLDILTALTRNFSLHPHLLLERVAAQCPPNLTGADLYALAADAMLHSMTRLAGAVDAKIAALNASSSLDFPRPLTPQYYLSKLASPEEMDIVVGETDFDAALAGLKPSVSQTEMGHYERVQRDFKGLSLGQGKGKGTNGVH